jgi:hypothetical protein
MTEPILDVLRRLREDAQTQSAPDSLEAQLVSAFREHHAPSRTANRRWAFVSAAIAASLIVGLSWRFSPASPSKAPLNAAPVVAATKIVEPEAMQPVSVEKTKVRHKRKPSRLHTAASPRQENKEFFRIPYAPSFDAYDSGQVVRMSMPGASVRRLGLPVTVDRVQADVLLGDDGVARAIRLVSNSGLNSIR